MTKYEFEKEVIFIRNQYMDYKAQQIAQQKNGVPPTNDFDVVNMIYEALIDLIKENKEIVKTLSPTFKQSLKLLLSDLLDCIHHENFSISAMHRNAIANQLSEGVEDILKA